MSPKDKNEDSYNPGDLHAREQFPDSYTASDINQTNSLKNNTSASTDIASDAEKNSAGFVNNVQGKEPQQRGNITQRAKAILTGNKKKSATFGVLGGFGIIGILFTLIAPSSLLISLTENLISTNDGAETAFQRRIVKVLGSKLSDQDGVCDTKRVKCKMGRISTKGLKTLEKKGVVALDSSGKKLSESESKYPNKKIARYQVDGFDDPIPSGQMKEFLANEPKLAAKLLGRSGAFNLRFELWRGKYFNKNFYSKWANISRSGGIADGENKENNKISEILTKVKERIPGVETLNADAQTRISAKTEKLIDRGKKGGVGYLTAVGTCVGVKTPSIIASGVAAVQVARLMPLSPNMILSPGSKNKASMLSGITSNDVAAAGTVLTATDKNGKSALDSKYFQSALGINKNKTGPSEDFSPGYSILKNPTIKKFKDAEGASESTCNAVLSPQAMYTAAAVDSAATVVASATIIGGLVKVAASWAAGEVVGHIIQKVVEKGGAEIIKSLAKNDKLDKVLGGEVGEPLGDALGISAQTFFSAGSAARHVPVLKESQLTAYNNTQSEQAQFQRNMDIASLNPFDTSSKYTFLGSIVHNFNNAAILHGGYNSSLFSSLAMSPFSALSNPVSAADTYSDSYCGYAEDFGMQTENELSPAVNAAGLPCYGYTGNISTESAVSIAEKNNWINDEVAEEADLDGITDQDSRLADYLSGCGSNSIDSGEWTETAAGCTIDTAKNPSKSIPTKKASCTGEQTPETDNCFDNSENLGATVSKSSTPDESEAVAAFAMDYQLSQSIDGFDEEVFGSSGSGVTLMSYNIRHQAQPGDRTPGEDNISQRFPRHAEIIKEQNPNIIGFQEAEDLDPLIGMLSDYTFSKRLKYSGARRIAWKADTYSLIDQGQFRVARYNKYNGMPWVKLQVNSTGAVFYVIDIHTDYKNASNRVKSFRQWLDFAKEKLKEDVPVFIVGDMNSYYNNVTTGQGNKPYQQVIKPDGTFEATINLTDNLTNQYCSTFNGFKQKVPCRKGGKYYHIDHIYVPTNGSVTVNSWKNVADDKVARASDHNPILTNVSFPGDGATITEETSGTSGEVTWPVNKKFWTTNKAAFKRPHNNCGSFTTGGCIDLGFPKGSQVFAMAGGKVIKKPLGRSGRQCAGSPNGNDNGGLMIESEVQGGKLTVAYAHGYSVTSKKTVSSGEPIMKLGNVGNSCGPHLHIDMTFNKKAICPQDVFIALGANQVPNLKKLTSKPIGACGR